MGYKFDREEYSVKLRNLVGDLFGLALVGEVDGHLVKSATKYLSPTLVVRAVYKGKRSKRDFRHNVNVSIGRPNYSERQFIKDAKKAGEPFPIKNVQLKFVRKG